MPPPPPTPPPALPPPSPPLLPLLLLPMLLPLFLPWVASAHSGPLGAAEAVPGSPMAAGGGDSEAHHSDLGAPADTKAPCRDPERLCFGDGLTFSIKENEPPDIVGVIRPARLQHLCPQHAVAYVLAKGPSDHFAITQSPNGSWHLVTRKSLDREVAERWNCSVECQISFLGDKTMFLRRNITINVIDEDDSPPVAKITTHEDHINNPEVKKGQSLNTDLLVVLDADSVGVNNYVIEIDGENIHDKLFDITLKKYEIHLLRQDQQVNGSSLFVTNQSEGDGIPSSTAIYIEVAFSRKTRLTKDVYITNITLTDVTLKGAEREKNQVTIELTLAVGPKGRCLKHNAAVEAHSKLIGEETEVDIATAYPAHVHLPSSAASYSRIAEPPRSAAPLHARLLPPGSPFAVTPSRGILYVRSAAQLLPGTSHLVSIQWAAAGERSASVNVTVEASAQGRCKHVACATRKSAEACASSCGVGAQEWCSWRPAPPGATPRLSALYDTCTPHSATCPDGACDELEEMDVVGICPQDCTREVYGSARRNACENNGRGIKSATGVCTCDPYGKCSCVTVHGAKAAATAANPTSAQAGNGGGDLTETIENKASFDRYHETCGESCFVAVVLGVMAAFSIVLAGGVLARRRRLMAKLGGQHAPGAGLAIPLHPWQARADGAAANVTTIPLGMHSQIYGQDDDLGSHQPELPLLNVHHIQMPRDGRWELARDALQLEGALGEGEFGLVLKAKLWRMPTGPDSPAPYMTVAVKTLKDGAGEMERAALESEFKLLQSVNHINVVRLIGACTEPGNQSFLMVIEYAELGSLRNYLRKSRLSDRDGAALRQLPIARPSLVEANCTSALVESSTDLLTPRHILSFAWQISKGMMYLSEMKLVHRDLAARNVLLTDKGICKISDFGLTRDVYEDEAYYKKSKGRVPVKWLAPESLSDHLYTTQSDVWSFGVLLWELVTLGSSPYPGVPLSGLFSLLHAGYRMQKPTNCSPELYRIMMSCWKLDPGERPSFQCIMASLEEMLQDEVEYLHLGALFAHNPTYFTSPLASNSQGLPLGNEAPCLYKAQQHDEDGEHAHTPVATAAHSRSSHDGEEAETCPWGWTDLNEGEGDSSDARTPLTTSFSQPDFNDVTVQGEYEDGYEVPISAKNRLIDSQDVVM